METVYSTIHQIVNPTLCEVKQASDQEYAQRETHFLVNVKDAEHLDQMAKMSLEYAKSAYPNLKQKTMKSDDGKFIVSWLEDKNMVMIVGIMSEGGKLERSHYKDIQEFYEMLKTALKKGKTLITSPNKKSKRMLMKIVSKLEKDGLKFEKIDMPAIESDDPEMSYSQVQIKMKK